MVIPTRVSALPAKLSSQRTGDDENTFDSMRVNSESVSKEIDESNMQLKKHFEQKRINNRHAATSNRIGSTTDMSQQ
jgi:hypothetical protein